MAWTKEQELAINIEGKNTIVSAGAGSGKTAVLTTRVIRKLKEGVHINELLILTFTNAASREMKERIRKNILKEESLKDELDLIDSAYITTFDSFTLSILKKYSYLLNISPNISPAPESLINIKKKEILDNIFNDLYEEENDKFSKLIKDFCVKDDESIKQYILDMNNKIEMKTDKYDYLNNYASLNYSDEKIDKDIALFTQLLVDRKNEINNLLDKIKHYVENDYYNKLYDSLLGFINASTYGELLLNCCVSMPALPGGSSEEAKDIKSKIKKASDDIKKLCKYSNIDEIKDYIFKTRDYVEIIIDILLKLNKELDDFKFNNDLYTFNDIAIKAINLVKENNLVREEIKKSFNEIMVDEYQDTNDLEEELINLISDNNVYMVGDIKQSIYRFRNANPDIFKEKYDLYKDNKLGYKIDLNKNFRSREEVLNNINLIFNLIMDKDIGGSDYINDGKMTFGNTNYIENGSTDQNNNMEIYNYNLESDSIFSKEEVEAFIIANDIKNKVNNKYIIFDKDNSIKREAKYGDFVILISKSKDFNLYKKIFEYNNVPLTINADEVINEDISLVLLKNLLLLITNIYNNNLDTHFKHYFISIMRSPLVEEKDEDIFKFFVNNNYKESTLYKKCLEVSSKISSLSTKEFILYVLDEFKFYDNLIKVGDTYESIIKLEYLISSLDSFNKIGYTVIDFTNYLDEIMSNNNDIKFNINKEDSNSVKIMTIHKSKGLEYPICYFPNLYSKFNMRDMDTRFVFNNKYGFISPIFDEGIDSTIYKELYKDYYLKEEISERIRLFYVALTRAKEKMIFLINNFDDGNIIKENKVIDNSIRNSYRSFRDIFSSIKENIINYIKDIDVNDLNITKDYNLIKNKNYMEFIDIVETTNEIKEINIDNSLLEEESYSKKINKLITKEEKDNMEYGTKIHYILECLDFNNPDYSNIEDSIKDKITKFLNIDILKDISKGKIYKEYEFIFEKDNKVNHGVIDLMIEYDDHIDIIDYKLKNISDENYIKQLNGYKDYIEYKTNKKCNLYLYSIMDEKYDIIK